MRLRKHNNVKLSLGDSREFITQFIETETYKYAVILCYFILMPIGAKIYHYPRRLRRYFPHVHKQS